MSVIWLDSMIYYLILLYLEVLYVLITLLRLVGVQLLQLQDMRFMFDHTGMLINWILLKWPPYYDSFYVFSTLKVHIKCADKI